MTTQMLLYLGILLLMMLRFLSAKKPHTTPTVISTCTIVLITSPGITPASVALSKFADHNILLIAGMAIVSAGFSRTQMVNEFSSLVFEISKGSFGMQMLGYRVFAFLLTNLIPGPMATFGVIVLVIATFCKRNGTSPSKVMQPIVLICICSIDTAPFGSDMYTYAITNSVMGSYSYAGYTMRILGPVKGQLTISVVLVVYVAFIVPKLASNQSSTPVTLDGFINKADAVDDAPSFDPVHEVLGYGIFFLTTVGPVSAGALGLQSWQIMVTDAALITAVGVLKAQEAIDVIPMSTMLMLVVAYATGGAMEAYDLGDMVDSLLASALGNTRNGYIIGFAFSIVPFLLTQSMQNLSIDNLFQPVITMVSKALGCNLVGLLLILGSAYNPAFITSVFTGTIPSMTEAGGYSQGDLFKIGWLSSILMCILSVFVIMVVFPAFP